MTSNTTSHPSMAHALPTPIRVSPLTQALIALALGIVLLVILIGLLPGIYSYMYDGRIFPGVSVGGIDISGMNTQQAADLLARRLDYPQRGRIAFQEGTNLWTAKP